MALTLRPGQPQAFSGIQTVNVTIDVAGNYTAWCNSSVQPGSALSIVIAQNGSTVFTSQVPNALQTKIFANAPYILCSVGDVISFTLSSANEIDSQPDAVKSAVNVALLDSILAA